MGIRGVEHIAICAKDMNALRDWYVRMFDGEVVEQYRNKCFVRLYGQVLIEFLQAKEENFVQLQNPHSNGVRHFAFYTDDFDATVKELEGKGIVFRGGFEIPERGIKNRSFRDPENNALQLVGRSKSLIEFR